MRPSLHDNKWFSPFFLFAQFIIIHAMCTLNLSHLAEHESCLVSGFKPILGPQGSKYSLKASPFYHIVTFPSARPLSFISFFCSLVARLLVRGCLMWSYPTIQAINVALSMHSSCTHPSINNFSINHICPYLHR